ncbi:MAG: hypothetical protein IKX28_07510 [Bacteroidales bacterium]|nr:hypothetical protein [Bacteroidales bacterium]
MKKILTIILLSCLLPLLPLLSAQGAERLRERVYISTDREVYVAGDAVWLSAWCVDAGTGRLSAFSKTAYVEVHSPTGLVQTAKIALDGGRGAGRLILPSTLPTGNYRLLAYTKLGASEEGFDPLTGARTLSVFNTFSTERTEGGVKVVTEAPRALPVPAAGSLRISADDAGTSGSTRIVLTNNGSEKIGFSLSVRHDDGIPTYDGTHIADFIRNTRSLPAARGFDGSVIPEYEGEIIQARVTGTDAAGLRALQDKYAFISSPGNGEDIYTESIGADGSATFFTSNIYGDQEMFLEIQGVDRDNVCHLELLSPFLDLPAGDIPPLQLYGGWGRELELRGLGMQLEKNFDADTLYTALPARQHRIFDERDRTRYILDDYTRFPVMEELFIEFISELRVRRVNGKRELQVHVSDNLGGYYFQSGYALVLLDGIPVLDHEKILSYDPLLVHHIDIYTEPYFLGIRSFAGVVNFVTYKGTLPSMQFEDNVRIVDFQGCSLPLAYTCAGVGRDYPDYRQTLYWHPLLTLAPGESIAVECKTPAYSGCFEVFAEGLSASGEAVSSSATLDVR